MFSMAWSPVRRTNAGRFEVDHPGDYATLNSYHPVDGTADNEKVHTGATVRARMFGRTGLGGGSHACTESEKGTTLMVGYLRDFGPRGRRHYVQSGPACRWAQFWPSLFGSGQ